MEERFVGWRAMEEGELSLMGGEELRPHNSGEPGCHDEDLARLDLHGRRIKVGPRLLIGIHTPAFLSTERLLRAIVAMRN